MPQVDFFLFPIQAYLFLFFFISIYIFLAISALPSIFKIFKVRKFIINNYSQRIKYFNISIFFNFFFFFIEKIVIKSYDLILLNINYKNLLNFYNFFKNFLIVIEYLKIFNFVKKN